MTHVRNCVGSSNASVRIPRENLENSKKYANEPNTVQALSGLLNAENSVIAEEAADIIERISSHVGAPESNVVAIALSNSGLTDRALKVTKLGIDMANNANDKVGLLQFYAASYFQVREFEKGRQQYKNALGIFVEYTPMNSDYVETTHFITEKYWAESEFYARQCGYVDAHVAEAQHHLSALSPGPTTDQYKGQFAEMQQTIKSCVP